MTERQVTITIDASTLQGIHLVMKAYADSRQEGWLKGCLKELEDAMLEAAKANGS